MKNISGKKTCEKNPSKSLLIKSAFIILTCLFAAVFLMTGCINLDAGKITEQVKKLGNNIEKTTNIPFRLSSNNEQLQQFNLEINNLVESVTPSVVNIAVFVKQEDFFGNERVSEGVG